jgi:choline dehydrogenase-like flavoprotein
MNSTKTEEVLSVFFGKQLNGTMVRPGIVPSVKLQKEKRILNFSATCDPEPYSNAGKNALSMIKKKYDKRDFTGLTPELLNIVYDLDDIVFGGDSRKISETQNDIQFYARSEQSPNRDSRVYLSEERDALGMRKLILDWQLSEIDKRTLEVMIQQLGIEFGRLDLGRVYRFDWAEDGKLFDSMWGGGHHMGTTRMSDNDKTGVVDKNCRVYNSDNLFIAGSSVYPTVGCVNPTLTIVALAIRLTDNLKQHLN